MVSIDHEPWESTDAARLRAAQRTELDARYGSDDHEPGAPPTAETVSVFLVARDPDGTAVGCGGLRFLAPGRAEIKRMYVTPPARGTGVAVAILHALEGEARTAGVRTLVLETGTAQPDAMRFYEREGYRRIDNFGPYLGEPLSVCYARDLPET
ncbi:Acetyltransferase (GNAT) family protein [Micromonospora phaseoli]|uniref:Acetyltransferase (GNAT) family protein n=1 Tax=Micromonospora phaseoli TaxID=1144548 RepID=A0A1H7CS46_9ACTN|nr:GNAT family N-acetyltransferase [Micromonospora phaseoli]PZV91642.1 acetyltransferase (GNAT) family protein [Micromonospora phaseoli]GIJ79273.1 N-acetyltransferase [Micromonospora phaseoli]SEJ91377.1 Acetyltransferase (GNAT) family protein [Micromonospora phaseoli]